MNKNKFIKKLLVAGLCALTATTVIGAAACKPKDKPAPTPPPIDQLEEYTVTFSHKGVTDDTTAKVKDGEKATEPSGYVKDREYTFGEKKYVFGGWYEDALYNTEFDFNKEISGNATVYARWLEWVKFSLDIETAILEIKGEPSTADVAVPSGGYTYQNKIFFKSGRFEPGNAAMNTGGGSTVTITVAGIKNNIKLVAKGASGGGTGWTIKSPDGTTLDELSAIANKSAMNYTGTDLAAGVYTITTTASVRFTAIEIEELMEVADVVKIEVGGATKDFLAGSDFNSNGLSVTAVSANGARQIVASGYEVDHTKVDMAAAGAYTVKVVYGDFSDEYDVKVYAAESLELGFNATVKGASTAAGNGTYVNQTVKQVYFLNDTLDTTGLTVSVKAKCGSDEMTFITSDYACEIEGETGAAFTAAGEKKVTVSFKGGQLQKEFTVNVLDITAEQYNEIRSANEVNLAVAAAGSLGEEYAAGTVVEAFGEDAVYFNTIQQALDFLNRLNLGADVTKTIYLAPGTYNEKLEINIPNLSVIGISEEGADAAKPVIEWNSLYGVADESGYVQTTDSSATLNVREGATNFYIKNVTVSNYWNSLETFNKDLGAGYGEHRALAILIQADKFVMEDCELLGYQDTIELFTGRQIIRNTFISGTTDFIFGTNNTTLFENCTIHSISNGKTDGGYITAFKGNNKDANDAVKYGAIFYKCNFTADSDVLTNGNTAIGRPWGAYAAVATIECNLDKHISVKGYSGASKNERYVGGLSSAANPSTSTVKFVEYGNTGAGAITTAVTGMKFLSAEEAAKYYDYTEIFAKTNGGVTYADDWQISRP